MRKLLLGSTAVAAAALFAPNVMAQTLSTTDPFATVGAPTSSLRGLEVRLGGYYRAFYNRTRQSDINTSTARLGSSDFSNEIEIHLLAIGKATNGLRYGMALEIENDAYRQPQAATNGVATNSVTNGAKNTLNYDEAWAFIGLPGAGHIRFGDEDGAVAQLQSGHITGFGVGGLDSGDTTQQVVNGNYRAGFSTVNDLGDNTKLIYLSPQFFGFDAGVSFAFNSQEGSLSGCDALSNAVLCDRLSAINSFNSRRRNEVQAALRWRGSFGPLGIAATVGYIGADSVKNIGGVSGQHMDLLWTGAQFTAYGFTVGGWWTGGTANSGFNTLQPSSAATPLDDRNMSAYLVGGTYTIDAWTFGGHFAKTSTAGNTLVTTGAREDTGWAVGGNFRIAPGLDLFGEYNSYQRKERGFNFVTGTTGSTDGVNVSVVLAGFRVAF